MRCQYKLNSGALIIELLLGLSLILIAVLSVFSLFPISDKAALRADQMGQAREFAKILLQDRLLESYGMLSVGTEEGDEVLAHTLRRGANIRTHFHYKVTISSVSGQQIYNIVVEVKIVDGSDAESRGDGVRLVGEKGFQW